jgi:hypothetical protein
MAVPIFYWENQMHVEVCFPIISQCLECDTETQVFTKNRLWINYIASLCIFKLVRMFDDFDTYFYEAVIEPYYDYIGRKGKNEYGRSLDLKLALASATSLFHLREHLPNGYEISKREFEKNCLEYALIADVVNASKHKKIDRNDPQLTNSKQIIEQVVSTLYVDEQGEYTHQDKLVVVILNSGEKVHLHDLLYKTIQAWSVYLHSQGLICNSYELAQPRSKTFYSREECKCLDLSIVSGLPFKMQMQLLKYDYQKGKVEPFDLTGVEVSMNVYKPIEFELTVTNSESGESASSTITLTGEETRFLRNLLGDQERQDFIDSLEYVQDEYKQLCLSLKNT